MEEEKKEIPPENIEEERGAIPEGEIEASLTEIYQDENGEMTDVRVIEKKKSRKTFYAIIISAFVLLLAAAGWFYYDKIFVSSGADLDFSIEPGAIDLMAGEEFFYAINYKNLSNIALKDAELRVEYPDNFIYLGALPNEPAIASSSKNNLWHIGGIEPFGVGRVKIRGKLIGKQGERDSVFAELDYMPENFSSRFQKTISAETKIASTGINISASACSNVLAGEQNEIEIKFSGEAKNKIDSFRVEASSPNNNVKFVKAKTEKNATNIASQSSVRPEVWNVYRVTEDEASFKIPFEVETRTESQEVDLKFIYEDKETGRDFVFLEKAVLFEVFKNDLNLTIFINGSRDRQGADYGEELNYLIGYANRGDAAMKNVMIMAVLDGDLIDWSSLNDENSGIKGNRTLSWSQEQIPDLAEIAPGRKGEISFSVKLYSKAKAPAKAKEEIKNYAQFSIGSGKDEDNRSNEVSVALNSGLAFGEQAIYFNSDNLAVGSGPLPPKVGETTSFKILWSLGGNSHDLAGAKVSVSLPSNVIFSDKVSVSAGELDYDQSLKTVVWNIGNLPVLSESLKAEFSVSIVPAESDRGKILVILPAATAAATDSDTGAEIEVSTGARTTKLEDDSIAGMSNDGVVR